MEWFEQFSLGDVVDEGQSLTLDLLQLQCGIQAGRNKEDNTDEAKGLTTEKITVLVSLY